MIGGLPEIPIYQKLSGMRSAQGNHSIKRGKKINSTDLGIDLKSHKESEIFRSLYLKASKNREELCNRLLAFKGIGPKTVEIFVRDMDPIWYNNRQSCIAS
jgi:hypothetical protein